jgi:hypothetical protein
MKVICRDRQKTVTPEGRALNSVAADINKLLSPKTYEQLQNLEVQVKRKLNSNEPIDTDYWEELLRSLTVWKARASLKNVYQAIIDERVRDLRRQQRQEAESIREKLAPLAPVVITGNTTNHAEFEGLDPEPLLQVRPEDKGLEIMDESAFLNQVVCFRLPLINPNPLLINCAGPRTPENYPYGFCPTTTPSSREALRNSVESDIYQCPRGLCIHTVLVHPERGLLTSD